MEVAGEAVEFPPRRLFHLALQADNVEWKTHFQSLHLSNIICFVWIVGLDFYDCFTSIRQAYRFVHPMSTMCPSKDTHLPYRP